MRKIITSFIALCFGTISFSQQNVFITLAPKVAGSDMTIGTDLTNLSGVAFNLEYFDYYLSNLHVIHDGGQDLDLSDTVFLIEPTNYVLYLGYLNVTNIEQINFGVGVPSNLNTQSGSEAIDISLYPIGHPLSFQDPSMHWGWTSGYTHMIIGGQADSNTDGIPDAIFQLHNLGDNNYLPFQLPVLQTQSSINKIDIFVNCNVDVWLTNIPIETVGITHGTTNENQLIMNNVLVRPVFTQSMNASLLSNSTEIGTLTFSRENAALTISWKNIININHYALIDVSGKKVKTGAISDQNGNVIIDNLSEGIYQFIVYDENSTRLNSIKVSF
jgi:hypothetical protein